MATPVAITPDREIVIDVLKKLLTELETIAQA